MAAIGLHLDNLLLDGFSHFKTAHHLTSLELETEKLGCQLYRGCQIIKEISIRY